MACANFSLAFSMSTGIVKKLLKTTRNKKKNHNKIVMLARSKLSSIERMKSAMKTLKQLLGKGKAILNLKQALE